MPAAVPFDEFYDSNSSRFYKRAIWRLQFSNIPGGLLANVNDAVSAAVDTTWNWARRESRQVGGGEMVGYCLACIDSHVKDLRRKQARRGPTVGMLSDVVAADERLGPEGWSETADLYDCIDRALTELERSVIRLIYWEYRTYGEVAGELGCAVGTVFNRMRTAFVKLRVCLEQPGNRRSE